MLEGDSTMSIFAELEKQIAEVVKPTEPKMCLGCPKCGSSFEMTSNVPPTNCPDCGVITRFVVGDSLGNVLKKLKPETTVGESILAYVGEGVVDTKGITLRCHRDTPEIAWFEPDIHTRDSFRDIYLSLRETEEDGGTLMVDVARVVRLSANLLPMATRGSLTVSLENRNLGIVRVVSGDKIEIGAFQSKSGSVTFEIIKKL
jgi:hypothetical protein